MLRENWAAVRRKEMTDAEHQALLSCLRAVQSITAALNLLESRISNLELAVGSLGRRMQLQEAGTALYEMQSVDRRMN